MKSPNHISVAEYFISVRMMDLPKVNVEAERVAGEDFGREDTCKPQFH